MLESISDSFILLLVLLFLFGGGSSKETVKSLKEAYKTFTQLKRRQQEFTEEIKREILSDVSEAVEPVKSTANVVRSDTTPGSDMRVRILEARIRELEKEIEALKKQAGKDGKGNNGSG